MALYPKKRSPSRGDRDEMTASQQFTVTMTVITAIVAVSFMAFCFNRPEITSAILAALSRLP